MHVFYEYMMYIKESLSQTVHFTSCKYLAVSSVVFVVDFMQANEGFLKWYQSYRFTSIYQVSDIQPATLHSLLEEFKEFANEKFHHYYEAVYTDTTNVDGYMPCGCDCKTSHLCAIEHVDYDAYEQCIDDGDISCDATKPQFLGALIVMSYIVTKLLT